MEKEALQKKSKEKLVAIILIQDKAIKEFRIGHKRLLILCQRTLNNWDASIKLVWIFHALFWLTGMALGIVIGKG